MATYKPFLNIWFRKIRRPWNTGQGSHKRTAWIMNFSMRAPVKLYHWWRYHSNYIVKT